jgi:hypothetical protein
LLAWALLGVFVGGVVVIGIPSGAFGATPAPTATVSTASPGRIGVRLLDVPAREADDPRARLYIVGDVAPGAVVRRNIEVSNTTSSDRAVLLYSAGATIQSGSFIGDAGHTANDLSSWTTVNPTAPQIPAGGTATATVTIAVPADATAGEQYAVVWAEVRTAGAGSVTEVNRVGVRVYLSVGAAATSTATNHHRSDAAAVVTVVVIAWIFATCTIAVLRRRTRVEQRYA